MREPEENTASNPPNINFVWTGPLKPSAIEGPQSLARAKNNLGQSYSITYWVEEEQLDTFKAKFAGLDNIKVKGIKEVIQQYCGADQDKESRIYALLARCKAENLPNIPKEILAPIIQSQTAGYFFDTSISTNETVNLPNLNKPAVSRIINEAERYVDLENNRFSQYHAREGCDLFAWFSAMNPSGEISTESEIFFSNLAENTICNWEEFFQRGVELMGGLAGNPECYVMDRMLDRLMSPIRTVYNPHCAEDYATILVHDPEKNSLHTYSRSTCKPLDKITDYGFTTIDARSVGWTATGFDRDFFCGGQNTGITKHLTGTWRKNFLEYGERYVLKLWIKMCSAYLDNLISKLDNLSANELLNLDMFRIDNISTLKTRSMYGELLHGSLKENAPADVKYQAGLRQQIDSALGSLLVQFQQKYQDKLLSMESKIQAEKSHSHEEQSQSLPQMLPHKAPKLTRAELKIILSHYHSSSGKEGRSRLIRKLRALTKGEQLEAVKAEDIKKALENSTHRYRLFEGQDKSNNTNMDNIVEQLRGIFNSP